MLSLLPSDYSRTQIYERRALSHSAAAGNVDTCVPTCCGQRINSKLKGIGTCHSSGLGINIYNVQIYPAVNCDVRTVNFV